MIIIIKPARYVAAIFSDDSADAGRCLAEMPVGEWIILKVNVLYPFYIVEQMAPSGSVFLPFSAASELSHITGTIYRIERDYLPPVAWTDHMGSLDHVHQGDDYVHRDDED